MPILDVLIVGGGASGFFCGCELLLNNPNLNVEIWEKSAKTLGKVRISGGGRCNVTHDLRESRILIKKYPRGGKYLRHKLNEFGVQDTINWFQNQGVELKTEDDFRMFPVTNSSETIAQCLELTFKKWGGRIRTKTGLEKAQLENDIWILESSEGEIFQSKYIVLAIGGLTTAKSNWLESQFSIKTTALVPSIFTLNINDKSLHELSGLSVADGRIKYEGFKSDYEGPVLITHWGISGPAVLASSAWHALDLHELDYNAVVQVGWIAEKNEDTIRELLSQHLELHKLKSIRNAVAFGLPRRLWEWIIGYSGISDDKNCVDLRKDERNRLIESLMRTKFQVSGRTTYKEEFVTAGGVDLSELMPDGTLKSNKNLYSVGEMLNIDGVTGGFNFQAAWSTAYVCAHSILNKC